MASRVMLSPVIEQQPGVLQARAELYCDRGFVNFFPSGPDGRNASAWVMTIGRAASWAAASADPQIQFLFAVPAAVDTPDELRAWLRATTVGDLPAAQRQAMQAVFDANAIPRADFNLQTPLARVVRRVASFLFEQDHNFGLGFRF